MTVSIVNPTVHQPLSRGFVYFFSVAITAQQGANDQSFRKTRQPHTVSKW